jgi:hypothetical protein
MNAFEVPNVEKEKLMQAELKRIDLAEETLIEKYKEYEELEGFVHYLSSMEKVFVQAKHDQWSSLMLKEQLIKSEVKIFGENSGLGEDVLQLIRRDFIDVCEDIKDAYQTAERLTKRYADSPDCVEFVTYLRDLNLEVLQKAKANCNINELKQQMYAEKIKQLTADGNPSVTMLEQIKNEFDYELQR